MNDAQIDTPPMKSDKTHLIYIILAIFLGSLGIHNFYAGYTGKAVVQLLLTVLSLGLLSPVVWIWVIIEICTVTQDANGRTFA